MRLTIIPSDRVVTVDGVSRVFDFETDPNIHAVQWRGDSGSVEQHEGGSRYIDSLAEFQEIIDAYNALDPNPAPAPDDLAAVLAAYRYDQETGGTTVFEVPVQTDRDTRANLIGARIKAMENSEYTVVWKTVDGFVSLTAPQIIAIADAVADHVQRCFKAEKEVFENLENYADADAVRDAFNLAYDKAANLPEKSDTLGIA